MSNYNSTATVTLSVNGKQAQQMLRRLETDALRLEKGIARAAKAGDKATMAKLQRELRNTRRLMQQLQSSSATVEQVMQRLDKAAPRELNKALRTLQSQLNGIERGSKAWDEHIAKIKAVKEELGKVNEQMQPQQGLWSRFNRWLNDCQTALLGIGAAVTGLVMAGKSAVQAYADMDPVGGDKIRAHGSGAMQIGYSSDSDEMTMYGKYTLSDGMYNFTLQDLILKDFTIRPGSNISFNGDPFKAILDINAIYRVNTNLADLDKSFTTDRDLNRTNVPVDAVLAVKGDLEAPEISFDIELPTLTQDVARKVKSIISTEDMMSRQIIYLLALCLLYTSPSPRD